MTLPAAISRTTTCLDFAALVALLVLGTFAARAEPPEERTRPGATLVTPEFTACLWNVRNYGVSDHFINNRRVRNVPKPDSEVRAMLAIIKELNPDVLALNEIIQTKDNRFVTEIHQRIAEAGVYYPHQKTLTGEDTRIQNVLFSRIPFVDDGVIPADRFPVTLRSASTGETTKTEMRVGRGLLRVRLKATESFQPVVYVVHFKSMGPAPEVLPQPPAENGHETLRLNEARLLRQAILSDLKTNPEEPILVLGDINDRPRSRTVRLLRGPRQSPHRLYDLWLRDYRGDWWTHFYYPEKSYTILDYVFVNESMMPHVMRERSYIYRERDAAPEDLHVLTASDHRPLIVTISSTPLTANDDTTSAHEN